MSLVTINARFQLLDIYIYIYVYILIVTWLDKLFFLIKKNH